MESPGIPIETLFPGAKIVHVPNMESRRDAMEIAEYKQRYVDEKAKAEGHVGLVEAEVERLKEVVLRLEGAIMAMDELAKAEAEEIQKRIESLPEPTEDLKDPEHVGLPSTDPEPKAEPAPSLVE